MGGEAGRATSGGLRSCACSRTGWGRHHHIYENEKLARHVNIVYESLIFSFSLSFSFLWKPNVYAGKSSEGSKLCSKTYFSTSQTKSHFPLLMSLHWLPINARIEYKISVICHSFFFDLSPTCLSDLLLVYTPKRNLRSSSDNESYVSLNCEQRHLGIAHFLLQTPQNGILCLQSSDILILSRNLR